MNKEKAIARVKNDLLQIHNHHDRGRAVGYIWALLDFGVINLEEYEQLIAEAMDTPFKASR